MHKKKALILAPFYPPNIGGAETFAEQLNIEMRKHYRVTVLAFQPFGKRSYRYEYDNDNDIYRIDWPFRPPVVWAGIGIDNFMLVFPKMLFWALRLNHREKFDIVYANGLISCAIASILNAKRRVGILHALYDFKLKTLFFRLLAKISLKRLDKVFVEGIMAKQDLLNLSIPEKKIDMYCHWCNQDIFRPMPKVNHRTTVLCAGRLSLPEKGFQIIKEAQRITKRKDIRFVYVEDVSHEDMPKYYQMADVVVVPSLYSESFPIVVIEAASCGCCVIASNRGSLPELVKDFGIAIEPTAENFAEQLDKLNRDKLQDKKQQALSYAIEHFSNKNAEVFL